LDKNDEKCCGIEYNCVSDVNAIARGGRDI